MPIGFSSHHRGLRGAIGALILTAAGCVGPRSAVVPPPLLYPADPSLARLQYLTSISLPQDIGIGQSSLWTALIGPPEQMPGIGKPYGVEVAQGRLYVCDTGGNMVHVIDLRRRTWDYFSPEGMGRLRKPVNLCVDTDGTRYIADSARGQVVVFDAGGLYLDAVGAPDEMKPTDVAVQNEHLLVADLKSRSVRVYERGSRRFLYAIPRGETNVAASLVAPVNLAVDGQGRVYVSDAGKFCIQQYDADGRFLRAIGVHGDGPGAFARNRGIAVDRSNRVYVVDAAFENCQIFDETGHVLLFFGDRGSGRAGGLLLPAGVAIGYDEADLFRRYVAPGFGLDYVVLIASQYGERKINVYGFLQRMAADPAAVPSP